MLMRCKVKGQKAKVKGEVKVKAQSPKPQAQSPKPKSQSHKAEAEARAQSPKPRASVCRIDGMASSDAHRWPDVVSGRSHELVAHLDGISNGRNRRSGGASARDCGAARRSHVLRTVSLLRVQRRAGGIAFGCSCWSAVALRPVSRRVAVADGEWETPLGPVSVDHGLAAALAAAFLRDRRAACRAWPRA